MAVSPVQAFSAYLFDLRRLARQGDPTRFLADAVHALRRVVPFRSAWWGEVTAGAEPRTWLQGTLALSASFATEWGVVAGADEFAQVSMSALDQVQRCSGYESHDPLVTAFCQRHDLGEVMAITLSMPESGLLFFICLYRSLGTPAFADEEAALFAECCRHLQQTWRHLLQDLLRRHAADHAGNFAMAHKDGSLIFLGADLLQLLARSRPGWVGRHLPADLLAAAGAGAAEVPLGIQKLLVACSGELILLQRLQRGALPGLTPRLRGVALLYAQGASHKDIACKLMLSPATVRTYLRDCYLMLGVRNKVELAAALTLPSGRSSAASALHR